MRFWLWFFLLWCLNLYLIQTTKIFSYYVFQRFYNTRFYMYAHSPFWATFYIWCKVLLNCRFLFFAYFYQIFPFATFCFKLSSPHITAFHLCQKSVVPVCVGLFLNSPFCFTDAFLYFNANPLRSWLLSFIGSLEIKKYILLFVIGLYYPFFVSICLSYNFWMIWAFYRMLADTIKTFQIIFLPSLLCYCSHTLYLHTFHTITSLYLIALLRPNSHTCH